MEVTNNFSKKIASKPLSKVNYNCVTPAVVTNQQVNVSCLTPLANIGKADVEMNKKVNFGALPKIFDLPCSKLTKEILQQSDLKSKNQNGARILLLKQAETMLQEILPQKPTFLKDITQYTNLLKKGLDNLSHGRQYKFVAIGQSPATLAEILQTKGVSTAICPLSALGEIDESMVKKFAQSKSTKAYLKYMKNFNMDFDAINPNVNYYFVDYTSSGKSLKMFEKIVTSAGLKKGNMKFISLQDVLKASNPNPQEQQFISNFTSEYVHNRILKDVFSPIFKFPYSKIKNYEADFVNPKFTVEEFFQKAKGSQPVSAVTQKCKQCPISLAEIDGNKNCNKLKYWFMCQSDK